MGKVYLDIDGVIVDYNSKQMPFLKEFLDIVFSISNGEVYWLTTHCHDGSTERAVSYLEEVLDPETLSMLKKVKPNKWDTLKTEGINLNEEFLWFDDVIFQSEYKILEQAHKEHCLIKVEDNLEEITNLLKEEL
jgi:hypothetical protein